MIFNNEPLFISYVNGFIQQNHFTDGISMNRSHIRMNIAEERQRS